MWKIIEDPRLVDQFRFPKSKKRRIREKWAKKPFNFKPSKHIYKTGHFLIAHPTIAAVLRRELRCVDLPLCGELTFRTGAGSGLPAIIFLNR